MKPTEVIKLIKEKDLKFVDFKFTDIPGVQQHFTIPASELSESTFEDGLGFDGSSVRGWAEINESDMLLLPDPATAMVDPFCSIPTLSLVGNIADPITRERYPRDPRNIAINAENYLKSTGIGDTCFIGPELEFFLFNEVRFHSKPNSTSYLVDSIEGIWNSGRDERADFGRPNLGNKIRYKEGYFPLPPVDTLQNVRSEMCQVMIDCGINVEAQHHEVASGGQCEIDMRFDKLLHMADMALLYKYIIRNVAARHNLSACFMPKPIYGDNGSGMHTHISVWKEGKNLMAGNGYAGLSEFALNFIGGILHHAPSVLAFSNPSTNSYKRLVPGYEAPINLAYSQRNRSASIRIPMYSGSEKAKRVEFRCPDPLANPYLSFSALLMAGLDGVQNKIDPGKPLDKNIYDLPKEEAKAVKKAPESFGASLDALESDYEFLLRGDVFTEDFVLNYIEWKRENEIKPLSLRPHPYEFELYYNT
ncbi:MAG: type I glutamate--ammonia ligase [Candidatus Sumerlaeia bacterium]|nr:type I glutamate--ammonia ligase [Candidatus Sumerlaeia bacterium]